MLSSPVLRGRHDEEINNRRSTTSLFSGLTTKRLKSYWFAVTDNAVSRFLLFKKRITHGEVDVEFAEWKEVWDGLISPVISHLRHYSLLPSNSDRLHLLRELILDNSIALVSAFVLTLSLFALGLV